MAEQESAATYGFDPARFKVVDDPKPVNRTPPPTDGVPNLLRGSLPQSVQLPPDFTAGSEYRHIPVYRLLPPQPSGVAGVNSAAQSTSTRIASTEAAGVVGQALPGTVGNGGTVKPATLANVADSPVRKARESAHSSVVPTSNPLTSTDAGATATITIGSYTLQVAGVTVTINSGTITGLSHSTLYYIYYSDPTFSGGAVTFLATTNKADTLASTANFFVGSIMTVAASAPNNVGNNDGGSASNQTGGSLRTVATYNVVVSGGGFTNLSNSGGTGSVSTAGSKAHSWLSFVPAGNDNFATSKVLNVPLAFSLTGTATGVWTIQYSSNVVGTTTIGTGTTVTITTASVTLPAGTDINSIIVTASVQQVGGSGLTVLTVSGINIVETS